MCSNNFCDSYNHALFKNEAARIQRLNFLLGCALTTSINLFINSIAILNRNAFWSSQGKNDKGSVIWVEVVSVIKLRHSKKLYSVSGITFLHMNRTKIFDLAHCFFFLTETTSAHMNKPLKILFFGTIHRYAVQSIF